MITIWLLSWWLWLEDRLPWIMLTCALVATGWLAGRYHRWWKFPNRLQLQRFGFGMLKTVLSLAVILAVLLAFVLAGCTVVTITTGDVSLECRTSP